MSEAPKPLNDRLSTSKDEMRLSGLMKSAQSGDAVAYRALLQETEALVSVFVKNSLRRMGLLAGESWEDLVQDILIAIHDKRSTFDPTQYFLPWMYTIARYKVIDFGRQSKTRSKYIDLDLDIAELNIAGPSGEESGTKDDLETLLSELPEAQRNLLEMVKIEGLSIQEAAKRSGLSESNVKVTLHRTLKSLKQKIGVLHEKS